MICPAGSARSDSSSRPQTLGCVLCWMLSGLFAAVLTGCDTDPAQPATPRSLPPTMQTAATKSGGETTPAAPLLDGWDRPAAAIVLSGEQHGYVEPCGCSETQSGGLARRHDLFKQLSARGWDTVGLDLGGSLKRTNRQAELKFRFTRNALDEMGYDALAIGKEELTLGPDALFSAHSESEVSGGDYRDGFDLPLVSANVLIYGTRDIGVPQTHVKRVLGGTDDTDADTVTLGATSIVGESYASAYQGDPGTMTIEPAAAALEAVLPELADCDVRVLLAHAKPDESEALARAFPQFDVVVTAGGAEDPDPRPTTIAHTDGRETLLLRVSQKGKYVGVLGVYPADPDAAGDPAARPTLKYELVDLDKNRFATSSEMVAWMQTYQTQLQDERLVESMQPIAHPRGTGYTGAKACGECHTTAYNIWKTSKHAHALDSLTKGRAGTEDWWVDRQFDAECLACHVTGWEPQEVERFEGGFVSMDQTPHLAGNQCENCHGPGQAHSELEHSLLAGGDFTDAHREQRQAVKLNQKTAAADVCTKCHDLDNSPHFDFDTYWPKVKHSGVN